MRVKEVAQDAGEADGDFASAEGTGDALPACALNCANDALRPTRSLLF